MAKSSTCGRRSRRRCRTRWCANSSAYRLYEDGPRGALYRIINRFFDTAISLEDAQANGVELYGTLTAFLQDKREHPADDLTTALIAARDEGSLSEQELMDNLILLLTAGFETTVNLIDNTVHSLLAHPDQLELVRSGRATWEDALEESLRLEAPGAMSGLRYAVEDIEIEPGLTIPKGDPLVVSFMRRRTRSRAARPGRRAVRPHPCHQPRPCVLRPRRAPLPGPAAGHGRGHGGPDVPVRPLPATGPGRPVPPAEAAALHHLDGARGTARTAARPPSRRGGDGQEAVRSLRNERYQGAARVKAAAKPSPGEQSRSFQKPSSSNQWSTVSMPR